MKRVFFLSAFILGFFAILPIRVDAAAIQFLCAGDTITVNLELSWPSETKKIAAVNTCLQYIVANNKTGSTLEVVEKNLQTNGPLSSGMGYTSNFCWCASPQGSNACTPTFADTDAACTTACSSGSSPTVSRRFETRYKDYQGTTNNNMCGNYCWCMQPTEATGTETRCTLHRDTPRTIGGQVVRIPLTSREECNTLCASITAGTRTGSAKQYQTTYRNYSGSPDCSAAVGATEESSSASAQRPSTPAPTIRLFNPMAGASTIVDIINRVINMIMGTVGAGALLMFVYGGIKWMTAGGDSKNVADAQMILKNATLGILLLMFSYTIIATFFSLLR